MKSEELRDWQLGKSSAVFQREAAADALCGDGVPPVARGCAWEVFCAKRNSRK